MRLNKKTVVIIAAAVILLVAGGYFWLITRERPPSGTLQPRTVEESARGEFEESNKKLDQNKPADGAPAKDVYLFHFTKGNNYSAIGQQKEAIDEFKKAEASGHPLTYDFYISLGLAYELDGDRSNAKKAYETAISNIESDTKLSAESKEARLNGIRINLERVQ